MSQNKSNQVVITGIGLVTPVGNTATENWQSILNGQSGIGYYNHPLADQLPCKIVSNVKNEQSLLDVAMQPRNQRKADRFTHLALIAAHEAMNDAGLTTQNPIDRDRFGVYLGIGVGGLETYGQASLILAKDGPSKISPFILPRAISNEAASWVSVTQDLRGPMLVMVSACSSGADAIGLAFRLIKDGYVDYMIAGGTESCITPESLAAFGNMRALTHWQGDPAKASRPFDKQRSGFVMAEGAGLVVLERKDLAQKRGAKMYAEVVGYGATADAFHMTAMHPEGRGALKATELALKEGGIDPNRVGYINAHGTSTPMNDELESMMIKKFFGDHADKNNLNHLLVSSTKSMTGHMLGAAGGVEVSYTALSLFNQMVPPTINLETPDEKCDLDYVSSGARKHSFDYALSNSFGFGGGNAVIALKRI